ncbi:MAG: L-threonylcarbamoyladenylate synthase [Weeksellaceae bacterium]|nr:L-threonylcarbamoyladenylate synthase [Weeksellaceae bacterium]
MNTIDILQNHGVILTPTDTILGLSCLITSPKALDKIVQIKQRPQDKGFIILVDNAARLQQMVEVPDLAWDLIDLSEKPITIVYDTLLQVPDYLQAEDGTVAIRMVKYPPLQKLIAQCKTPLISTSANIAGQEPPKTLSQVHPDIISQVDLVTPDSQNFTPQYTSSSIIRLSADSSVKIIRE